MRRDVPLLLVLASGLALAACGQQTEPPASHARPTSSDDPRFQPLAAYDMPDDDGLAVGRARWTLARECMVRLGFDSLKDLDIDPPPAWPKRPAGSGVLMVVAYSSDNFRYGVQDPEEAARYGYQGAQAEYERLYPEKKWTLSEHLALTGEFVGDDPKTVHGHRIPKRGCLGDADRTVFGSNRQDRKDPILNLETKSLRQGMRDLAWKKADKAWSVCMRKAGYHYATPKDAETGRDRDTPELQRRLADPQYAPDEPTAPERKTAIADARCKQKTGYVRTVHAIDVRIQNQLIPKNRTKLEEQRRWNRDATRKAHDILEDRS
ncbi:hypothetical protein [Streptomyces sporangiiformans]|uniref:Lipoprotein n=1 Tax=Streptomyces sporangiiformans TaxID=2315329 RepID=A0A505DQH9_9ACTN|nr:hypothetical protein [Streptomyces sporangiiformans]TPQ23534.1 hypothetical protein FGD71_003755 [Streptomyces sporangiiformans]